MSDDDLYDLADDATGPKPAASKATTPLKVGEGAVAPAGAMKPTVAPVAYCNPRSPHANADSNSDEFAQSARDFNLPLALIGGGLLVEFVHAWIIAPSSALVIRSMGGMGLRIVVDCVLVLTGLTLTAAFRKIKLGKFHVALLKLCALSIGPGAVMTLTMPIMQLFPLGGLLNLIVGFCACFAFLGAMFDMDQDDTAYCMCIICLIKLAIAFVMLKYG